VVVVVAEISSTTAWWLDGLYGEGHGRVGWAIVQAAVDWQRTSMARPILEPELRELHRDYLPQYGPLSNPTDASFEAGLEWAKEAPRNMPQALLEPRQDGDTLGYRAFDYLVAYADESELPELQTRPSAWEFATTRADSLEVIGIAFTAQTRKQADASRTARERAAELGDPLASSTAAFSHAGQLEAAGDVAGAAAAYQEALELAPPGPGVGAFAGANLGMLRAKQGDMTGAEAAYRKAIALGDPVGGAVAAYNLIGLLQRRRDRAGLDRLVHQMIAEQPLASVHLGELIERNDTELSALIYLQVLGGDSDAVVTAARKLGDLLCRKKDLAGAERAYRRAVAADAARTGSDSAAEDAGAAALGLGVLLAERGDVAGAEHAYHTAVVDSGHPDSTPEAAVRLALLLEARGDVADAKNAYRTAVDSGHPKVAPTAALLLGVLLDRQGDAQSAQAAFQQALDSGDASVTAHAAFGLGKSFERLGDLEQAKAAYQWAIREAGDSTPGRIAAERLAALTA